jgi:hypothetical protein
MGRVGRRMTADEFEQAYAAKSGLSVEELRASGRVVVRCACGASECEGWASVSKEAAADYEAGGIYYAGPDDGWIRAALQNGWRESP